MSGVSPTVVCVTPDTQIYFFDHPKRQPQTLRLSFSISRLSRQLQGMYPPMPSGKSTAVSGQTVYATHCPGHNDVTIHVAMPFAVSSGQATATSSCRWLVDYSSESRLFDLSAIISNATLSSCVYPPCMHTKNGRTFVFSHLP